MSELSRIGGRLAKLLPVLASDRPGEVTAAAAAITRTLKGAGLDWHALAAAVASEAERQAAPAFTFGSLPPRTARKQIALLARSLELTPAQRTRMEQMREWLHGRPVAARLPAECVAFLDDLWRRAFGGGASR
ncbi:hypothetical protein [Sediminicoccus sp. BL-A-41-H5]|uniref:hypothetical protein n=1 Tax=Sediminicoccus sp. BL-A-41-H5 TaxID=3421106 RepID=UPI003D67EE91